MKSSMRICLAAAMAVSAASARAATISIATSASFTIDQDDYWSPTTDVVYWNTHNGAGGANVSTDGEYTQTNPMESDGNPFGPGYWTFEGPYKNTFTGTYTLLGTGGGQPDGIHVNAGSVLELSGGLAGSAGIVFYKRGPGTLILSGATTIDSDIWLNQGYLRADTGVGLQTAQGVHMEEQSLTPIGALIETSGSFAWSANNSSNPGAGELGWRGSGGFSAYGGNLTVDLGTAGAQTYGWNGSGGVSTILGPGYNYGGVLFLNTTNSDGVVTFTDNLYVNQNHSQETEYRRIHVEDNPDTDADYAVLAGTYAHAAGQKHSRELVKTGAGRLDLLGINSHTGITTVAEGILVAGNNQAMGTAFAGTVVSNNATLAFNAGVAYTEAEAVSIEGTGATGWSGAIDNLAGVNTFAGTVTLADDATIGSTAGRLTLQGGVDTAGNTVTFDGAGDLAIETAGVTGAGNVVKDGAGTLYLSGTHDWSGTTTVNDGSVKVNATTSGNGDWTVNNGGELGGTGTIGLLGGANSVTMTAGSTITPGFNSSSTIGDLTISGGDLVFDTGTVVYQWTFDASTNDVIAVNDLVFNAGSVVEIELYNNLADLQATDSRVLFTYTGSVSGTPSFTYDGSNNPQGLNVYLVAPNVIDDGNGTLWLTGIRSVGVPEPSTLGMLLLGGLLIRRRMRRARRA